MSQRPHYRYSSPGNRFPKMRTLNYLRSYSYSSRVQVVLFATAAMKQTQQLVLWQPSQPLDASSLLLHSSPSIVAHYLLLIDLFPFDFSLLAKISSLSYARMHQR